MEVYEEERPPEYVSHAPNTIELPPVPQHDFVPARVSGDIKLPDLKTVLSSPEFQQISPIQNGFISPTTTIRSLPPIDVSNRTHSINGSNAEWAGLSALEQTSTVRTDDSGGRSTSAVSMDDPNVRIAAEALSGLGNPDFARSPEKNMYMFPHSSQSQQASAHEREPLLDLLTQAHPWVGGTINGSMSAYETTKYYSPGFVRAGVGLVERNIAMPMVATVGSMGKMTGAENVARWYLNARRPGDMEHSGGEDSSRGKRRRLEADEMDVEVGLHSPLAARRDSQESRVEPLPAYRASKPPSYREEVSPVASERTRRNQARPTHNRSWSSQIVLSTSGLGIALSEGSRNSLLYCLGLLSRSAEHIATVSEALRIVLEQYDQARDHWHRQRDTSVEKGGEERPRTPDHDESARRLAAVIKKYSDDIWETLKKVVTLVSNTTGSALPANARNFVRNQLMSLPGRWRHVSANQTGDSETSRNAHRMIAFARQGLDMITEVSHACQDTLERADDWLSMVGRRRALETPHQHQHQQLHPLYARQDEEMTDAHEEEKMERMQTSQEQQS